MGKRNPYIHEFGAKLDWLLSLASGDACIDDLELNLPKIKSQKHLAEHLGIAPNNITHWIKGPTNPDPAAIRNIARLFGFAPTEDFAKNYNIDADSDDCWTKWWALEWSQWCSRIKPSQEAKDTSEDFKARYMKAAQEQKLYFQNIVAKGETRTSRSRSQSVPSLNEAQELGQLSSRLRRELEQIPYPQCANILSEDQKEDMLSDIVELIDIASKEKDNWDDDDIMSLILFQQSIQFTTDKTDESGLVELLDNGILTGLLQLLAKALSDQPIYPGSEITLDNEIAPIIRELKEQIERQQNSTDLPDQAKRPLKNLHRLIRRADRSFKIRLDTLDICTKRLRNMRIGALRSIEDLVSFLVGRRLDLAPPLAIFRDLNQAWCPEMIIIPPGKFMMGSPEDEEGRSNHEGPQHEVTLSQSFAVGRFAVSFNEWDHFAKETNYTHRASDQGWERDNRPVINVSWDDAQAYVKWLSGITGERYRLLSEAEWEYCCRAGMEGAFWWGSSISTNQANYDGNYTYGTGSKGEYRKQTVPVDSFDPNLWGLYNVHGNVWEWCSDHWHESYKGASDDGSAWVGTKSSDRVLRGGSWGNFPLLLRSANRDWYDTDYRDVSVGFRIARTLTP